ncbi:MAG: flagellar basal body rod protein FlgB [Bdellovibrionales bacterium]
MTSSNNGLMGLLSARMGYLSQKQSVYAENVANANTPGYKARDVAAFSFGAALKKAQIGMAVTDSQHIVPASMAGAHSATVKVRDYETTPDGNAVDVEQEMMKVSQTGVEYQLVTSLYRKMTGLLKVALKGNSA